jgi:hypothetical protein
MTDHEDLSFGSIDVPKQSELLQIGFLEAQINGLPFPNALTLVVEGNLVLTGANGDVLVGVPEPATWALLLIGFAGIAFASYRRLLSSPTNAEFQQQS